MQLAIYKLEDNSKPLCILSQGQHSLGRGAQLDCTDKRISRNHVSIVIEVSTASFSLVHHTNPCYWKCAEGKHIALLKPNTPVEINDGDTFGFCPDVHWFRIKFCEPEAANNNICTSTPVASTITTPIIENLVVPEDNAISNNEISNAIAETTELLNAGTDLSNEQQQVNNQQIIEETEAIKEESAVNTACDSTTNNLNNLSDQPSCSNTGNETNNGKNTQKKVFRDTCWYGQNCYRKNLEHQTLFSHPGDADYEIDDPKDNRPPCPYGRNCYRRNGDHRREFKHSQEAIKPPKTTNKRPMDDEDLNEEVDETEDTGAVNTANILPNKRKRKTKKQKDTNFDDEDEDDEEPFATDEDDDYEMSDSD